jgi:hypothetical protein
LTFLFGQLYWTVWGHTIVRKLSFQAFGDFARNNLHDISILLQEVISEMEDPEQMGYIHLDRQDDFAQPQTSKFFEISISLKNITVMYPLMIIHDPNRRTDNFIFV